MVVNQYHLSPFHCPGLPVGFPVSLFPFFCPFGGIIFLVSGNKCVKSLGNSSIRVSNNENKSLDAQI